MGLGVIPLVLIFVAVPFALREPQMRGLPGYIFTVACWVTIAFLLSRQNVSTILMSLIVSRSAMIVLAWIARPAADSPTLQARVTSFGAVVAIVMGIGSMIFTGGPMMFLVSATAFVVIRLVMAISYARIGGVNAAALAFVRQSIEVLVLLIGRLPGLSPSASGY